MTIHCQITEEDYIRAQYLHVRPRPVFLAAGVLMVVAALTIIVLKLFVYPSTMSQPAPYVLFAVLVYLALRFFVIMPMSAKRIYREQKTLHDPYEVEITEETIRFASRHGGSSAAWRQLHKYKVGKDFILLYPSRETFHMFPRRWFSDEQFTEFQGILARHLKRG
jgi:hypothetical protein